MRELRGRVAVVSGAGSGIGRALAYELAARGCRLALTDIDRQRVDETTEVLQPLVRRWGHGHDGVIQSTGDASDRDATRRFAEKVVDHFGAVDLVINNAGVALDGVEIIDLRPADLERILAVNLWGVVHGTQAFLPALLRRSEAAVVNISSLFGITGIGSQAAYCTSKFAVRGFTESLRMELRAHAPHVRAVVVHPGGIRTNIARDAREGGSRTAAQRRLELDLFERTSLRMPPTRAAQIIVRGIHRGRERILVGLDARIGDLMARLAPERYTRVLLRQAQRSGLTPSTGYEVAGGTRRLTPVR